MGLVSDGNCLVSASRIACPGPGGVRLFIFVTLRRRIVAADAMKRIESVESNGVMRAVAIVRRERSLHPSSRFQRIAPIRHPTCNSQVGHTDPLQICCDSL